MVKLDFSVGITPAYAGKSQIGSPIQFQSKDHPRLCGEKRFPCPAAPCHRGSPPPMRGKVLFFFQCFHFLGITPAYAGKSLRSRRFAFEKWDHPRLCGEKPNAEAITLAFRGSPPPMRGKATTSGTRKRAGGIPPAYAGKSFQFTHFLFPPWDHPRLCGEKCMTGTSKRWQTGSPPPMRGKVHEHFR